MGIFKKKDKKKKNKEEKNIKEEKQETAANETDSSNIAQEISDETLAEENTEVQKEESAEVNQDVEIETDLSATGSSTEKSLESKEIPAEENSEIEQMDDDVLSSVMEIEEDNGTEIVKGNEEDDSEPEVLPEKMENEDEDLEEIYQESSADESEENVFEDEKEEQHVDFLPNEKPIEKSPVEQMQEFVQKNEEEGLINGYFYKNGKKQVGEYEINGHRYYFNPDNGGKIAAGLIEIPAKYALDKKAKTVYCSMRGNLRYGHVKDQGIERFFLENTGDMARRTLIYDGSDTYYFDAFGLKYKGLKKVNGFIRYFDIDTGKMAHGLTVLPTAATGQPEKTVFFDEQGNMVYGRYEKDGEVRYFDTKDGHMLTGMTFLPKSLGGPKNVYLNEDGLMLTGDHLINGKHMYFAKDGQLACNSIVRIGDGQYYYDQKGYRFFGPKYLRGHWKYFDEKTGKMAKGYVNFPSSVDPDKSSTVYFDEQGNLVFGQKEIDGDMKCFNLYDGTMFKGLTYLNENYGGPKTVYYDDDGNMTYGSVLVNGTYMYFDETGNMVTNSLVKIGPYTYFYDENGKRQYGQKFLNGHWMYFDLQTGLMQTGLVDLPEEADVRGEKTVYYDKNGYQVYGPVRVDGKNKYFDEWDGHMVRGLVHTKDEKGTVHTVYYDENGNMVYGPQMINGKEMYFKSDGEQIRNMLVEYENKIYYYDQNGYKYRGQIRINGKWKYFDIDNGQMHTGLTYLGLQAEPAGEKIVYYDENGDMVTGLKEIDGHLKYFDLGTGAMQVGLTHLPAESGTEKVVCFDEIGNMVFGPYDIDGRTYQFDEKTGELLEEPVKIYHWAEDIEINENQAREHAMLIWEKLKKNGWSRQAAAGILANMDLLSGLNPKKRSEKGAGLLQLEDSLNLRNWYKQNNLEPLGGNDQIERLFYEKDNSLKWKKDSRYPLSFTEYSTVEFKPSYTAMTFAHNYLDKMPQDPIRLQNLAETWYQYLKEMEF